MSKRIFVRGYGAWTPASKSGVGWEESLAFLMEGKTAVREISHFDVSGFPSRVGAWIGDDAVSEQGDRRELFLKKAIEDLELRGSLLPAGENIGVFIGAESGRAAPEVIAKLCQASTRDGKTFDHERFVQSTTADFNAVAALSGRAVSPAAITAKLAQRLEAKGPAHTISLACASSLAAMVTAVRQLRQGVCDHAIVGGVGADVDPFMLAGFGKLGALSAKGNSCPFDLRRDGFVVGEGAAVLWLSTEPGDEPLAQILGVGASVDAYHLTAPHPNGEGAERAMRAAFADANVTSVDYVQAHGTSTFLNDAVECKAISRTLRTPYRLSSIKGALGHWIAGAGALGTLAAIEALRGNVLPTAGLQEVDKDCPGSHVIGRGVKDSEVRLAMVNAFAFGGANVSVILGRT